MPKQKDIHWYRKDVINVRKINTATRSYVPAEFFECHVCKIVVPSVKDLRGHLKDDHPAENKKTFQQEHRGSFLGSSRFRQAVLAQQERRRTVKDASRRRKRDRAVPKWSRRDIEQACQEATAEDRMWCQWRSRKTAVEHLEWFLLFTEATWSLERIRGSYLPAGAGHSRISMAISNIRMNDEKLRAAHMACDCLYRHKC